jgi:excisionase family DNA binding protein
MDELLDAMQVGTILHVHANSVHRLVAKGELKSLKVGSRRLFSKTEITRYIQKKNRTAK